MTGACITCSTPQRIVYHGHFVCPQQSQSLNAAVVQALKELDAEHYPDPELKGRGGCFICWPKDGSWPCATRLIADELRQAIEETP